MMASCAEEVRCPNCWLGPEECTPGEVPPYVVAEWVIVCPRCPGGLVEEADEEGEEDALRRAIREAAANAQPRAGGGGGGGGGRPPKKPPSRGATKDEDLKPVGRPEPQQRTLSVDNVDPKSEVLSLPVSTAVREWLDSVAYNRQCHLSDVIREALGDVMGSPGTVVDVAAGEKAPRTSPVAFLLSKGEIAFLFRTAKAYGMSAKAFVHAILSASAREHWDEFSRPKTPQSSKIATGRVVPRRGRKKPCDRMKTSPSSGVPQE